LAACQDAQNQEDGEAVASLHLHEEPGQVSAVAAHTAAKSPEDRFSDAWKEVDRVSEQKYFALELHFGLFLAVQVEASLGWRLKEVPVGQQHSDSAELLVGAFA
jgi:hypothetical protein